MLVPFSMMCENLKLSDTILENLPFSLLLAHNLNKLILKVKYDLGPITYLMRYKKGWPEKNIYILVKPIYYSLHSESKQKKPAI